MTLDRGRLLGAGIMTACAALGVASCAATQSPSPARTTQAPAPASQKPASTGQSGTSDRPTAEQDAARASGEKIPAGVTAVTLAVHPGVNEHGKSAATATVTSQAEVGKLTALIDGLPAFPAGTYPCPMDDGAGLVLTFKAGRDGPARAVATVKLAGCEGVDLTVGGRQQPALGQLDGGRTVAAQALKIAKLGWSLPH